MALQLDAKDSQGVKVLSLAGRVTLGDESSQLRNKIKELLSQGNKRLVLDLGGVSYVDSAGLGTLVAGYTSARNEGGEIRLANVTKRLGELLSITKLLTVFSVYDSVEAAVKSFS